MTRDLRMTSDDEIKDILFRAVAGHLFSYNDAMARNQVVAFISQILPNENFTMIQCDEYNNPPHVIESNQMVAGYKFRRQPEDDFKTIQCTVGREGCSFEDLLDE